MGKLAPAGLLIAALGISLASGSDALAAGTGTGLVVAVDPGLQLSCASKILFTPTPQQITQAVTGTASSGEVTRQSTPTSVSVAGSPGTWNVTITGLDTTANSLRITEEALGICTVSAIGFRFGSYVVTAALTANTTLVGPGGSQVRVTRALTRPGFSTGAYGSGFSVGWFSLFFGLGGSFDVDFQVEFDLTSAGRAGTHASATPGVLRVTATAP